MVWTLLNDIATCRSSQCSRTQKRRRKTNVKKFLLLTVVLLFAVSTQAQTHFSKVEIKATKVAGNVYMLQGAGGNIGVSVGDDGLLIVDDQFAPLADKIRAALKGIADKKLHFILNTHWHGDHTGGNVVFGPEATIIAHANVRKRLATEQKATASSSSARQTSCILVMISLRDDFRLWIWRVVDRWKGWSKTSASSSIR